MEDDRATTIGCVWTGRSRGRRRGSNFGVTVVDESANARSGANGSTRFLAWVVEMQHEPWGRERWRRAMRLNRDRVRERVRRAMDACDGMCVVYGLYLVRKKGYPLDSGLVMQLHGQLQL